MLQHVVTAACELTGAGYGGISVLNQSGKVQNFVTHGVTGKERLVGDLVQRLELSGHPDERDKRLRLDDLASHLRSLGHTEELPPNETFLGMRILHRDTDIGNFYLAGKEGGGAFTGDDEELLLMFASQAATTIVSASMYRDEQRARTDLETLIDTSPVAVLLFNGRTGELVSYNREAERIATSLSEPGVSLEEVFASVTIRRGEYEVDIREDSIVRDMGAGETLRLEEIFIETPDGRHLTAH